ncbi:C1q and tumor necrosis factor-related protein-like protein 2 [Daphnia pulex]|uniref:C1q and tumor necrosis factor-related protein-like protein 2 n=1 Tax=Daphnia pulex TaxID=6669 RepID=E9GST9_DAPPU|nr:C1q and tumor necrosis factor-related protein-like protein 2 [Daphnia pulex]|eukprot:EFX77489.1 C1q and tumor necrosis factor-related protein-like protein 2 [Daphnia pulex]
MAITSMRCILVIFLAAICCKCQSDNPGASSSWAKLQISPDTLSSMKYGNFLVEIYEHANNHKATTTDSKKKYFYSPIALLDHKSAVSRLNRVTKQQEMRFRVEMWNDKVENEVVKYLNEIVGHQIKSNQVRVIPLEKVILTSNTPATDYSLSPVWTNYDKSKTLRLSLSCFEQKICDELASEMRSDPEQFDHFKLLYSLSSQTSQIKQTTIRIDSVTSGQMVSTLLQKFGDKKEIFLTANDEKKMLTETATNIRMDTFDDSEVGSPDTEFQISNILKDLLVTSRTTIKEQSDKMWDSVFWNEDNYRPDKTTKTLNEILNKLDTETQKKLAGMFQKAERLSEITEKLTSSNKDEERRREEQIRRENQSKDANENERRRSEATDQGQTSRNQTRDDKSNINKVDTEVDGGGWGIHFGVKVGPGKSNTRNAERENEKTDRAKTNSDEHDRELENKERIQHNFDSNSWANADRISSVISGKMAQDSDSSRRVEIMKEEIAKLLQESRDYVQWDGEKFVPKPMQLSRINLGKFRDSQSFQDRSVRVRYTTAELSAPIKFLEHTELTVTDEWNNLKEELKATTELLSTTVNNLVKTNTELRNAKSELTKTRIDFTNKLEGTKKELGKTEIDLEKTKNDVNDLFIKLNATEKELAKTKITTGNLSTELKNCVANSDRLGQELKVTAENLKKGLRATSTDLKTTKTSLASTRTELNRTKSAVADLATKFKDKQKWIGYADVKSAPVHFYVQRNYTFYNESTPIPFDLAMVNEGNAMDLTSGIFTAPRPGIYFFSFAGTARLLSSASNPIGASFVSQNNDPVDQYNPVTLQSTLNLKKGDQVWVEIWYTGSSSLHDDSSHHTHFTGFMLGEEIVASL